MELTIEITQYCEYNCDYCSSNASEEGKHLAFDIIKNFLDQHENVNRINISGGEPLSHPEFYKILKYCKTFTDNVWIYTNAIDRIIYNTNIIKEIQLEANVCLVPGTHVYLPANTNRTHLLQLIRQGRAKDMKVGNFHISRNLIGCGACEKCNHFLLQADEKIVSGPCKKNY